MDTPREPSIRNGASGERRLAHGLGWLGAGLGVAQLVAPRPLARSLGLPDHVRSMSTLRAVGARELASSAGILLRRQPAIWLWLRVAGDLVDLALLGAALSSRRARPSRLAAALAAVAGVTVLDLLAARRLSGGGPRAALELGRRRRVTEAITVNRPVGEVFRFWRALENLPRFMAHLASVEELGDGRSRWVAKGPADTPITWHAVFIDERPNELIAWRSLPGSNIATSGSVRFRPAPGGRGTEVYVELRYAAPGGAAGVALAKLLGRDPGRMTRGDLRRFKQVMETGEVLLSDATAVDGPHPAQPAARDVS